MLTLIPQYSVLCADPMEGEPFYRNLLEQTRVVTWSGLAGFAGLQVCTLMMDSVLTRILDISSSLAGLVHWEVIRSLFLKVAMPRTLT